MEIRYNKERLRRVLEGFSVLTGLTIAFWDAEGNPLCGHSRPEDFCSRMQEKEGRALCAQCDARLVERCKKSGQVESHLCHMGLFDMALPVSKDGIPVGHLVMGRVRSPQSPKESPLAELQEQYAQTPELNERQIQSIITLLPEILFERAIEFEELRGVEAAADYIRKNLQEDLSVETLCGKFFLSKNALYQGFRDQYHCTVNGYITEARIEQAKALLLQTDEPVYAVAARVGIENYTYFCKLFKKHTGKTPMEYRKNPAPAKP